MKETRFVTHHLAVCASLAVGCALPWPSEGRTERSHQARAAFKKQSPCPATGSPKGPCPGYVIDHVVPLACGGADSPGNMQWQTTAEAREKDRWERRRCKSNSGLPNSH